MRWCRGTARPGTYHRTLTGTGPYGAPTNTTVTGPATGTVNVVRQVRPTAQIAAPLTTRTGANAVVRGRLLRYGTSTPLPGRSLQLWRRIGTGSWHLIATATTDATGRVTFTTSVSAATTYQVRHEAEPALNAAASLLRTIRAT